MNPGGDGSERGQALVLWALTILLISLMVLVTLGVGMRARDRVEAQVAADAAVYTQAVATARTMNAIALLTRTQASHMVAMTSVESLISWSGQVKAAIPGTQTSLGQLATAVGNNPNCTAADLANVNAAGAVFATNAANFNQQWDALDAAAGLQAWQLQGIAGMGGDSQALKDQLLTDFINQQVMTRALVKQANPELDAMPTGDGRSVQAVSVFGWDASSKDAAVATMGSRGDVFTRDRSGIIPLAGLTAGMTNVQIQLNGAGGGSGFGSDPDREPSQVSQTVNTTDAWAEDHAGTLTLSYANPLNPACTATATATTDDAWVTSTALQYTWDDQHNYTGTNEMTTPLNQRHTLGPCNWPWGCPGMWPGFYDYDEGQVANVRALFGQPVLYSIVHRDLTGRKDPWNLAFNFLFDRSGTGATFDNGSPTGAMLTQPELRYQVVLSTGIAYYHRPGNFQEPPNLFNPFWRATLISAQKYNQGVDEPVQRLGEAGFSGHATALQLLYQNGFRGLP